MRPRPGFSARLALLAALAVGAPSALAETAQAEAGPAPSPEIGLCTQLKDLEALKAGGFDYAELRTSEVAALSDADFAELRSRLQRLGLRVPVTNVFVPADIKLTGPSIDEARQIGYVRKAFDRLAELGTTTVIFGSGDARRFPEGFPKQQAFDQLAGFCRRIAPEARARGITIAVEPLRRQESNIVNSVAEALRLADAVSDPNLQVMVDFYHLAEEREDPGILETAAPRLRHVHMANPTGRVYPLAWGEYDYAKFFETLRRIGYRGRLSVEAQTKDFAGEAPRAIAFLREALRSGPPAPSPAPRGYASDPVDTAHGDRPFLLLWPEGAPGAHGSEPPDQPKLTLYPAPAERANGAAAVVCPGGGYRRLASDHEGKQVALWLNSLGVGAFVLQYRVGPRYQHPAPIQDAQRALRLVRSHARDWGVDPARVGIVGFSAGGHLAATAGTHFDDGDANAADPVDRLGSRPDFLVLGYPVILLAGPHVHQGSLQMLLGDAPAQALVADLSNERAVTSRTPPAFLFHTTEDATVPVENSLAFYAALRQAGVAAELHVFQKGRHGVGLAPNDPVLSQWPRLCADWLRGLGLLERR